MPMVRKLYPQNWEQISRRVKRAATWCCEACDRPCLLPGEDWLDFMIRCDWTVGEAIARYQKPVRYQLSTAHINHDPENPAAILKAWCTPCHGRYDLRQLGRKRVLKLERFGQGNLFDLVPHSLAGHGKDRDRVQPSFRQPIG